jgi:hypothetical protein
VARLEDRIAGEPGRGQRRPSTGALLRSGRRHLGRPLELRGVVVLRRRSVRAGAAGVDLATASLDRSEQLPGRRVPDHPLEPQHPTVRAFVADPVRVARCGVRLPPMRRRPMRHGSAPPSDLDDGRGLDRLSALLLGVERVPLQGHEPVDGGVADLLLQLEKRMVGNGALIDTGR